MKPTELRIGQEALLKHRCSKCNTVLLETTTMRWWCPECHQVWEIKQVAERCFLYRLPDWRERRPKKVKRVTPAPA